MPMQGRRARWLRERLAAGRRRRKRGRDGDVPDPGCSVGRSAGRPCAGSPSRFSASRPRPTRSTGQVRDLGARISEPARHRACSPGDHGQGDQDQRRSGGPGSAHRRPRPDRAARDARSSTSRTRPTYGTLSVTFGTRDRSRSRRREGLRPGDRGRSGNGQPRRDRPGPGAAGDLVRHPVAADPARVRAARARADLIVRGSGAATGPAGEPGSGGAGSDGTIVPTAEA